jgi:hypothetical protein
MYIFFFVQNTKKNPIISNPLHSFPFFPCVLCLFSSSSFSSTKGETSILKMSIILPPSRILIDLQPNIDIINDHLHKAPQYVTLNQPHTRNKPFLIRNCSETLRGFLAEVIRGHPQIHPFRTPIVRRVPEQVNEGEGTYIVIWSRNPSEVSSLDIFYDALLDMRLMIDCLYTRFFNPGVTSNVRSWRTENMRLIAEEYSTFKLMNEEKTELTISFQNVPLCIVNMLSRSMMTHSSGMRAYNYFQENTRVSLPPDFTHRLKTLPVIVNEDLFLFDHPRQNTYSSLFANHMDQINDKGYGFSPRTHTKETLLEGAHRAAPPDLNTLNHLTTLVFELQVECVFDPELKQLVNSHIFSHHFNWIPLAGQRELFLTLHEPFPHFYPNIPLFYLGEGKSVHLMVYVTKGMCEEHAKFRNINSYITAPDDKDDEYNILHIQSLFGAPVERYFQQALTYLGNDISSLVMTGCRKEGDRIVS